MRLLLGLAAAALVTVHAAAQIQTFPTVPTLPATCNVGDVVMKTGATPGFHFCSGPNTWQIAGSGGEGGSAWGGITGTLSNQTDLQTALDAKAASSHAHVDADIPNTITVDLAASASALAANPAPCSAGMFVKDVDANGTLTCDTPAGGGLPSGFIGFVISGSCPSGTTEVSALDGKMILGTLLANANVGTTGGSDTITPAGTNSGAAVTDHASHTHTYTQVPNHVHGVTTILRTATTGGATTQVTNAQDTTSTADATRKTDNPDGGVASGTTAGPSATLSHSVTQPTFTGTQFDNRPAFTRVIFCQAN